MANYVPTVDEVRYWVAGRDLYAGAEFDRMIATVRADHEKAVRERIAQDIEELEHTAAQVRDLVRAGKSADWPNGWDSAVYAAARIVREGA